MPVPGVLGLPDDRAADPAAQVAHFLDEVGTAHALRHRHDDVMRKAAFELGLDVDLQDLALPLLRALLALALDLFERLAQIVDQLVLFLELQILLPGLPLLLAVDAARHFEIELAGAILDSAPFLAQRELRPLCLLALLPLLGELAFEELFFEGEIGAGLLLRLAGEHGEARLVFVTELFPQRVAERDLGAAIGAGDHGCIHGRLFTVGRANLPGAQACAAIETVSGANASPKRR
jgi:hypothetical protein